MKKLNLVFLVSLLCSLSLSSMEREPAAPSELRTPSLISKADEYGDLDSETLRALDEIEAEQKKLAVRKEPPASETDDQKSSQKKIRKSLVQALAEQAQAEPNLLMFPRAFFSPNIKAVILNLINNEQEEIKMAMYHFSLYDIADAWVLKRQLKNVKGYLIVNDDYQNEPCAALRHLIRKGIMVGATGARSGKFGIMHHKFIIFKNNTIQDAGKKLLVSGSFNCTPNASSNNHENIIIHDDQGIINQFEQQLESIKERSTALTVEDCSTNSRQHYKSAYAIAMAKARHGIPETEEL